MSPINANLVRAIHPIQHNGKKVNMNTFKLTPIAAIIAMTAGNSALADESEVIESITVTAQKRVQSIQDVPMTISAYNGDFLESIGFTELDALSEITPGLIIQEQSPNNPGFVIRGITSDSGSSQVSPRVSIYYNGADISRSRGSYFEMFDIERVEVVKGPQATLFGTAASVGAISAVTNKPQEDFDASITASLGNYSARTFKGFVTGGNSKVQGRFAFSYRERDGYIDNTAENQEDLHGIERTAFRPSLRFTPNNDLTIDLVYTYEENDDSGTAFKNNRLAPTGGDTSAFSFVEASSSPLAQAVFGKSDLGIEREVEDINLTVNWDISDSLTFTSITAAREFDSLEVFDADGSQAWFLEFAEDAEGDQLSQEFRVVQSTDKFTNIFGISYFEEDGSQAVPFSTEESIYLNCLGVLAGLGINAPCVNPDGSVNVLSPVLTQGLAQVLPYQALFTNFGENESYSAFADVTYLASPELELTVGLRYVSEDKTSGYSSVSPNSALTSAPLLPVVSTDGQVLEASDDFDDWLPRFNLLYRLNPNTNVYATIAKGRRSEVIDVSSSLNSNFEVVADVTDVPAEIVWNYETGVKGKALDGRLDYLASVFYQDYSDFQVTQQDDAGQFFTANAGSATNFGAEFEVRALLSDSLEMFANAAYIDATIDDDNDNGNLAGNRFRLQPENTFSAGLVYDAPLSGELSLTGSFVYTYRSEVFFEEDNNPLIKEGDISLANAKVGIANHNAGWAVSLFANNLFDEEYLVDAGNTGGSFGYPTFVAGPPAFYGIEASISFGE